MENNELVWSDARELVVEGRGWDDAAPYCRLPDKAESTVPGPVWALSRQSAGMCVRFVTDSPQLKVRYALREEKLQWPEMTAIGSSGLDLYARPDGLTGRWRWVSFTKPEYPQHEAILLHEETAVPREYALYLPLYNGVSTVEIGVAPGADLQPAPPRPNRKVLGFYGTSIVHGGCAARAGMAYPAILGRRFDCTTINLGFSGSGKAELAVADLLTEVNVDLWVIDCLPNLTAEPILERMGPLVRTVRAARPDTPIVLVENVTYQQAWLCAGTRNRYTTSNAALREVYDGLVADGLTGLTYFPGDTLLGDDGDATCDGTHPSDLGFVRMADALEPVLRRLTS